ncbi:aminopeptidase P family protein [bacterium]|nr:aminopeptidase P family protein [bacterium]
MTRMEQFKEIIEKERLDGFLVTNHTDIRYLTGFTGDACMLWVEKSRAIFITDFRYETQSKKEVENKAEIYIISPKKSYFSILKEQKIFDDKKLVGFDENVVNYAFYRRLAGMFMNVSWIPLKNPVSELRAVKDNEEINKIVQSVEIAIESLVDALPLLRPGITEKEFSAELEYRMKRKGSEKPSFETIVASGWRAALPHGIASDKIIESGEMVTVDFGATYNGYASDLTRTFFIGKPDNKFIKIYEIVLEAQLTAANKAKAGMTGKEIDGIARKIIEDAGYGEYFGHGLGHGIGLVVHDSPGVNSRSEKPIRENSVITIEPGIYIPDWGGVRIEDDFIVKSDGTKWLSSELPKEISDIIIPVG